MLGSYNQLLRSRPDVLDILSDYYRVPDLFDALSDAKPSPMGPGFFQFGSAIECYGHCSSGVSKTIAGARFYDSLEKVYVEKSRLHLPFDPAEVVDCLRLETYEKDLTPFREKLVTGTWALKTYYFLRNGMPTALRRSIQRAYFSDWKRRPFPAWPVDLTVDDLHEKLLQLAMAAAGVQRVPFIWFWPDGAPSCLILTHDVETSAGRDFTSPLMDVDECYGFRASLQVIPEERYRVSDEYVRQIRDRGFEFNIHDLSHDGRLYRNRDEFLRRATKINEYARRYNAHGFRAGAMYRNMNWYDAFEFSYDMSVPNVAHLEPKRGGCCTVFPYFVGDVLELPLTTTQDYSLIHILRDYSLHLWNKQLDLIRRRNGLMSFLVHPDYLIERRARRLYESLLGALRELVTRDKVWAALPGDVDRWWRIRRQLKLSAKNGCWQMEGPGKERARIAYAVLDGDRLTYEISGN